MRSRPVSAIGHTPVRFEDFTAQPLPSREACLAGVATADAYLLILGPNYGYRFPDTGQSPTHDEWVAAQSTGIPRLVYRKLDVTFEAEQETFVRSIGDYATGVFYDTFSTTAELLTKVAGKLRELQEAGNPLAFSPLTAPVTVTWRTDFEQQQRHGFTSPPTALEVHVVPANASVRPARIMGDLANALPARLRESGLVNASEPLTTSRPDGAIMITVPHQQTGWDTVRDPQLLGIRLSPNGQASVWATLPGDGMGSILDDTELPKQVAGLLRLIGQLRIVESPNMAIDGEPVAVIHSACLTADDPRFFLYINQIEREYLAPAGIHGGGRSFMVVLHKNNSADLYTGYQPIVTGTVMPDINAGDPVDVEDVTDPSSYRVPDVDIAPGDRVVCVVQSGWKFGLYFDFSRNVSGADEVWGNLGPLADALHTARIVKNLQLQLLLDEQPHILTEGKTDLQHLEAARRRLVPDLPLRYFRPGETFSDSMLYNACEQQALYGPPNKNKSLQSSTATVPVLCASYSRSGHWTGFSRGATTCTQWCCPFRRTVVLAAIPKAAFARCVLEGTGGFADVDFAGFGGVFKRLS
ncbi:hypothetical protein KRM28CT15_59490 [Krasilnikovia sp. M28-CT-15]